MKEIYEKFYLYARGSFEQTKAWLRKAIRRKVISSEAEIRKKKPLIDFQFRVSSFKFPTT